MGKCDIQEKQLLDYFENKLDQKEVEEMQFHLLSCRECRIKLEKMRKLTDDLCDRKTDSKPSEKYISLLKIRGMVAIIGGLILVAIGGYYYLHTSPSQDIPIEMIEPPLLHSGDSLIIKTDTIMIKKDSVIKK